VGEFDSLLLAVRRWMLAGRGLDEVEEELIEPATVSDDEKAAVWLLGWSMLAPERQLAEVQMHIARVRESASRSQVR
jgi:hypothetical protein